MQQRVDAAQAIELAEFLPENALEIPSPKGTHRIFPTRTGFDSRTKPVAFLWGQLLASSLSGSMLKSLHARLVVATHPFLNRSPRRIQRFGDLLGRAALFGQHNGLHANPHSRIALRSSQTPQLVQSMTIFHMHPCVSFQKNSTHCARIKAWR
jgi:hypothetical protein